MIPVFPIPIWFRVRAKKKGLIVGIANDPHTIDRLGVSWGCGQGPAARLGLISP